ncbi:MAG: peptidoglycan DD-metalloendopeptidase family protein [Alphaproteobacteria bacterium]|nr:peptidoglycan DD-metalloendopeptidase family protein [Alphaproteobacteria bacterium]
MPVKLMNLLVPTALVLAGAGLAAGLTVPSLQTAATPAEPSQAQVQLAALDGTAGAGAAGPQTGRVEAEGRAELPDAAWDRAALRGVMALSTADSLLEEPFRIGSERRTVEVRSGDTVLGLLLPLLTADRDAHNAVAALETAFDPRDLQIGQEVRLLLEHHGHSTSLTGLEIMPDVDRLVVVSRDDADGFVAETIANDLETRRVAAAGIITESLAADAERAGVPYAVLHPLIRMFAHRLDLQRNLQQGDAFEILFERDHHEDGSVARLGPAVYGRLVSNDRDLPVYRFETADGFVDWYDREGESFRRALLRTPLDNARMSSGYGMRRHPILGYTRMHQGIDFAAASGTPIVAAGDGRVEIAGRRGGYGNYVRLQHNGRLSTAYAHLSRFAAGIRPGARVRQGQVIGYVGSTGLSTGPHLHYEVLVNGSQVNPLSVDLPVGRTLEGADLAAFRDMVDGIERRFAELRRDGTQFADRSEEEEQGSAGD